MSTRKPERTPWAVEDDQESVKELNLAQYDSPTVVESDNHTTLPQSIRFNDDAVPSQATAYLRIVGQLEQPLDRAMVKRRLKNPKQPQGPNNPLLDYLDWPTVVRALNRIFGYGRWDMDVRDIKYLGVWEKSGAPKAVVVTVNLTVNLVSDAGAYLESVTLTNVGVGEVSYDSFSGLDIAVKGAVWDGVKRCATALGEQFGLSLYDKETPGMETGSAEEEQQTTTAKVSTFKPRTTPPSNGHSSVGESFECEDCGKQVRGYTSKTGKTYTTEDLYNMSVKATGAGYCYDCKAKYQSN